MRKIVDSIFKTDLKANIIIAGDFNDEPKNISLSTTLGAKLLYDNINDTSLYNMSNYLQDEKKQGSHKYEGKWGMLDQFIVSGALLSKHTKISTGTTKIHIYNAAFLLEPDKEYLGDKPKRTYNGFMYNGGFSDHLPTYLDFDINN